MNRRSLLKLSTAFALSALIGCGDPSPAPRGLIDHRGKAVSGPVIKTGGYTLLFFGFTDCPLICPTGLNDMARLMDRLPPDIAAQTTPVFVSIDPERDTPAKLKSFLSSYDRRMIGVTGSRAALEEVVKTYDADYRLNPDGTVLSHSSFTLLLDSEGKILKAFPLGFVPGDTTQTITAIIRDRNGKPQPGPN